MKPPSELVQQYFGETAEGKSCWSTERVPGFIIIVPGKGHVKWGGGAIEEVRGDLYAPALKLSNDILGYARVAGSPEHLAKAEAHGAALEIEVVFEVVPSCKKLAMAVMLTCAAIAFVFFSGWGACFVALVMILIAAPLVSIVSSGWVNRRALIDGLKYKNQMPDVHQRDRKASKSDLEEGGWLE